MLKKLSKRLPLYGRVPRRVMAVALVLVMCMGMLPVGAFAAEGDEAKWGTSEGNLTSSGTFVAAMDAANDAQSGTTYIQLQKDVTLGSAWSVDSGRTTVLDLNGKIIDRGLTGGAAQANGYVVDSKGNLTIKDSSNPSTGKITGGNNGSDGGGVHVDGGSFTLAGGSITSNTSNSSGGGVGVYSGSFTMTGGSISGNTSSSQFGNGNGGGVSVFNGGTFTMTGGSITGNTSTDNGGGVYFDGGTFHVSGGASVKDNIKSGSSTASNVYLPDNKTITVTGALTGTVSVSTKTAPTQGTSVDVAVGKTDEPAYTITDSDAKMFVSDSESYCTSLSGDKVVLSNVAAIAPEAEWTPSNGEKATGTFAAALAAMTNGGSIKLLTDVSTTAAITLPAKAISLDLGGKTWTSTNRTLIPNSGKLTLKDTGTGGKILSTGPSFTVERGGKLNLSGGTIAHNSDVDYPALSNDGAVTMSGGTIARSGRAIKAVENKSDFSITGGEITSAAGDGIENKQNFTMTGGSITAHGSGMLNNYSSAVATITGGSITSTKGYGIFNRSGTLHLGGTANITATEQSALYTTANLCLSGTPTLTKSANAKIHQINNSNNHTIAANDSEAGAELAYYAGEALDIYFGTGVSDGKVLVTGLKDEAQSKKFNVTIGGGNMMEPVYNDTAKTISAKAIIYNITYKDRAKAEGGANFSGAHGTDAPKTYTAGTKKTLVDPTKVGYTFGGWYERAWGSTDKAVTELKENPYGDKTFYAKWSKTVPNEQTATPSLTRTVAAASAGEDTVYFGLREGTEYQEHVEYKLYTTADGNTILEGVTMDTFAEGIRINPITADAHYWLTVTEDGKTESDRVEISVRAKYSGIDEYGDLAITTPQELADYLNYCEPSAATVSGTTVTLEKDVPLFYAAYFAGDFDGTLDLNGFTATAQESRAFGFNSPDAANVKFTLKGGGTVAAGDIRYAIAQKAGKVVVENTTLIGEDTAIFSSGGTLSLTDVTARVPNTEVTDSATLFITPNTNLTIHSGTFINGNSGGYTYYSQPGSETLAKTLASCIASGSTSVPANSTATDFGLGGDKYQICTRTITVTKGAPPAGAVTGVTLNRSVATLYSNPASTTTLTAIVTPANATNKEVTWTSSTPSVATVDANGKVTAVANGTSVITATTADGSFTATCAVTVKTLVTVTMADFVYGEAPTTPKATADAIITYGSGSAPTNTTAAGTYTVTATKDGSEATATFKILKAPVSFTVENNVKTWTGGNLAADVTATPNAPYNITYRQNGTEVTPAAVGTYDIFAALISANYRHASGSDGAARKIGSFTILEAGKPAPTKYTVTFTKVGGTGTDPTQAETLADCSFTLPANPYTFASHAFAGWSDGAKTYQAGASYTMPAKAVTFTAVWTPTYTIGGDVKQGENSATGAAVTLMRGTTKIATALADAGGNYSFADVPAGDYNLVATKDGVTKTILCALKTGDVNDAKIVLPEGKTNSVVEVKDGAPEIVVGGLEKAFDQVDNVYTTADAATVSSGGSVEFRLVVQETVPTKDDLTKINGIKSTDATLGLLLDLKVDKTSTTSGGTQPPTNVPVMNTLLESIIPLSPEMQGKAGYIIYRIHGTLADAITEYPNADGEKLSLNAERNVLTLYAKKYSAYAIAYTSKAVPPPSGGGGGGGGGGGSLPSNKPEIPKSDGGSVTINTENPSLGDKVIITPKPDAGKVLDKITVTDKNGKEIAVTKNPDGTFSFIQPEGGVTIAVTFKSATRLPWNPFEDVKAGDWFHDSVKYLYENGLMSGTDSSRFSPNTDTSRGMIVTILWRLEGKPVPKAVSTFADVEIGTYYADAVAWAAENGIVRGYDTVKFGPKDPITREQLASILYRYARFKGMDTTAKGDLSKFTDQPSAWAAESVRWAVGAGIISGKGDSSLDPKGSATRAETAVMLKRYLSE